MAGTDGSGTVIIEIHVTSTEKGHCKPKNDECKQTKSCSINFKIHTPAGSTEFHVNTAEVDAEVTDGDLDLDDWTTTDGLTTDGDGDYTAQPQTAGCGKWKHISAFAAGATVSLAKVTLQCGLCDENELPH